MAEPAKSNKAKLVGLILLAVLAAAYVFVLYTYQSEGENRAAWLEPDTKRRARTGSTSSAASLRPIRSRVT